MLMMHSFSDSKCSAKPSVHRTLMRCCCAATRAQRPARADDAQLPLDRLYTEDRGGQLMPMMRGFCGISLTRRPADADDARDSLMLMMRRFCESGSAQRPADADDVRLLFDQDCTETGSC